MRSYFDAYGHIGFEASCMVANQLVVAYNKRMNLNAHDERSTNHLSCHCDRDVSVCLGENYFCY